MRTIQWLILAFSALQIAPVWCAVPAKKQLLPQSFTTVVVKGENLFGLFKRNKLALRDYYNITSALAEKDLQEVSKLYPGQPLYFENKAGRGLERMLLYKKDGGVVELLKDKGSFVLKRSKVDPKQYSSVTFELKNSLYADGRKHGLKNQHIQEASTILERYSPIRVRALQPGSRITLYLEGYLPNEGKLGSVVALDVTQNKKTWSATRYKFGNQEAFFDPLGMKTLNFLKYPLDKFRVSSVFSASRVHPVLRQKRPHYGVDLATRHGAPVYVTADGVVKFVGSKGGYGKTIIIDHGMQYQTVYAHLSGYAKGMQSGDKVKQNQVIGFVGSSGIATGPHLHYEVRHAGKPQDPLRWSLSPQEHIQTRVYPYFKKFHDLIRASVRIKDTLGQS